MSDNLLEMLADMQNSDPLPHQDRRNTRDGRHRYSLLRAIDDVAGPAMLRGGNPRVPRGLEGEVHRELEHRYEHRPARGLYVPSSLDDADLRALDTSSGAGAANGDIVPIPIVDCLRARSVLGSLGARVERLPLNRQGKAWVPRRGTTASVQWVPEGFIDPPQSTPSLDHIEFEHRSVMAWTDVTRTMLRSSYDPEFERQVSDDIALAVASEIDKVAIQGPGSSTVPLGLLLTPGVQTVALGTNGGPPTRDALVELERLVSAANGDAAADASLGWFGSPNARARLRKLDGSTAGSGAWVWSDDGKVLGHPAFATTNAPSTAVKGSGTNLSTLCFGDFHQLLVGLLAPLDLMIDRQKGAASGTVRVVVFQDLDIHALQPAAFGAINDMATT